jgi:AcrR family transcriptional regulator
MTERLAAQDWIDFALKTLTREGFEALKADVLARKLGVSRGSFYWHFRDLAGFHVRVIEHWKLLATEAIIADLDNYEPRQERLDRLLRRAFGHRNLLEIRMRAWADNNAAAAQAIQDIDCRRRDYVERMLIGVGIAAPLAATRAQLLYWAYLGAALSGSSFSGEELDRIVIELKKMGLSEAPLDTNGNDGQSADQASACLRSQTAKARKKEGKQHGK